MTYYKLRKDTPTVKAGARFEVVVGGYDNRGLLARLVPLDKGINLQWKLRDIDDFDEWFEKVQETTDSIHRRPAKGCTYFYTSDYGSLYSSIWCDTDMDNARLEMGFVYPTEEECKKAKERRLAEVRLRQTSTFTPDFENGRGGWFVAYNHLEGKLEYFQCSWQNAGESVRYETREDAEESIEENKEDWLIYFGVEND